MDNLRQTAWRNVFNIFAMRQRKLEQQKLSTEFQKVQRLSAERQREYVDKAKAHNVQNDAYENDEEGEIKEIKQ
ncbi:hypothetical protein C2G38_2190725 [Gigaspora rosea]|uniref:Uncharacterized protein n=1 Tax=Gigaspora rosea TaxID=44941 RepID=A0A397V2C5_9GLOM|nr:hypothetical protein C2G38_2190725 [Gigaspora rosea]